ncbi:MAG: hypothetical protein QXN44_00850 [Candidatus Caldarchaeum sp.]
MVLDPFAGVGTTPLTCREMGVPSIGVEVSPLFQFIADVKLQDYDFNVLRRLRDEVMSVKFVKPEYRASPFIRKLYPRPVLEDVFFFKKILEDMPNDKYRRFITLALVIAAEKSSYIYRDGSVVKAVKNKPRIPSLRKALRRVLSKMIKDVETSSLENVESNVVLGDARRLDFIQDESIDIVITSPPYLNKIEYTQCYWPEYELFFPNEPHSSLRSYIGVRPDSMEFSSYSGEVPPAAHLYFEDMGMALRELHRVLKHGGRAVVVVGGGVFPHKVIETDVELAALAEEKGFRVDRIVAVNKRAATTRRVVKIGETRESIIYLSKL